MIDLPSRIVKESIRTSDTLASVSSDAERLFWRLVTSADDYGRFDGRTNIILGQCLSVFVGLVSEDQVESWVWELADAGLIGLYEVGGRRYLHLTSWEKHQRTRAKDSKFPAPDVDGAHPLTNDSKRCQARTNVVSNVSENESESENESGSSSNDTQVIGDTPRVQSGDKDCLLPQDEVDRIANEHAPELDAMLTRAKGKPFAVNGDDFAAFKDLIANRVPWETIREVVEQKLVDGRRFSSFRYFMEPIKELHARRLAEARAPEPINFDVPQLGRAQPATTGRYIPRGYAPEVEQALREDDERERLKDSS